MPRIPAQDVELAVEALTAGGIVIVVDDATVRTKATSLLPLRRSPPSRWHSSFGTPPASSAHR